MSSRVGIVVIGRNEGERLRRCLRSILGRSPRGSIVYVDSGSVDESVALARQMGVDVLELDPSRPFSAARARNEGFERLLAANDSIELVQFIDGDCELHDGWIERACAEFTGCARAAIVCGVLREREPQRSIYNRLCALEWMRETGEVDWCGGIFMARARAFKEMRGLRTTMIAGEEPEFCARLRAAGWSIRRIYAEMANHDAAIMRFGQWWRRAVRAGHGWAERAALHGRGPDAHASKHVASILFWGVLLPVTALSLAWFTNGLSMMLLAAYPLQWLRVTLVKWRRGFAMGDAALYSLFTIVDKFAGVQGMARYAWGRLRSRPARLIEHKQPSVQYGK